MPEPEFLCEGQWLKLSEIPRPVLEQWYLDMSARSQEMHRRVRIMTALLDTIKGAKAEPVEATTYVVPVEDTPVVQ